MGLLVASDAYATASPQANIQITSNGVNRVGGTHTFTGHVNVSTTGVTFQNAPDGTVISFTIDSGPGGFTTTSPCTTSGGTGSCTITLSSAVTGVTTVSAHTTVNVLGFMLTRNTDGVGANSGPATATWVNAKIAIAPNATNEVGQPHTFTVTLQKDTGSGFGAAAGEAVTVTLTDSNGAVANPAGPFSLTTNANGQVLVTFTSVTGGKVTGHASSTLSVAGSPPFTVQTDGVAPNSGDAVKTFVDGNIQITPNGTNRVGQPHTFTAHVKVDAGDGSGFQNVPDGTQISFTIDSGPGAFTTANPCTTAGGTGSCQISLGSAVTGVTTVSAHTTVSVGGVTLTRDTDGLGANSGPATKTWVNAKIAIAPNATNEVGQPHTFTVTLQKDTGSGLVAAAGEAVTVTLTNSNGAVANPAGPFNLTTNANGQVLVTFTSITGGRVTGHASSTLSLAGSAPFTVQTDGVAPNSGDAVKTYVDANIQIDPPTGTNPVNTNHTLTAHVNVNSGSGFQNVPDGAVISFTIDSGPGAFTTANPCTTSGGTGSCTIVLTSAAGGVTTVSAHTTVSVGGVTLTRQTDGAGANSGPATKTWQEGCPDAFVGLGAAASCGVLETGRGSVSITGPPGGIGADVCIPSQGTLSITGRQFVTGSVRLETGAKFSESSSASFTVVDEGANGLADEIADCQDVSAAAASLCPGGTPITKLKNQTLDGICGQNVYCVKDVDVGNNDLVTINAPGGCTTATFIFNVTGKFVIHGGSVGGKIKAGANMTPSQILYNVIGSGPDVAFSGGGGGTTCCNASVDGTLIAEDRKINLGPGRVNGVICSEKNIAAAAGSSVCPAGFPPQ